MCYVCNPHCYILVQDVSFQQQVQGYHIVPGNILFTHFNEICTGPDPNVLNEENPKPPLGGVVGTAGSYTPPNAPNIALSSIDTGRTAGED